MLSIQLFKKNKALIDASLNHPFVQGIASGELQREKFVRFMSQDAFYLTGYARAFAAGLAKSLSTDCIYLFKELLDSCIEELKLHKSYSEKWGFSLEIEPGEAVIAYTDFLIRAAFLDDSGHILAATAPCFVLYGYIGNELAKVLNPESPYREWVETYSSPEAAAAVQEIEFGLNQYCVVDERAGEYYRRALELEYRFFDEAYRFEGEQI